MLCMTQSICTENNWIHCNAKDLKFFLTLSTQNLFYAQAQKAKIRFFLEFYKTKPVLEVDFTLKINLEHIACFLKKYAFLELNH